MCLKNQTQMRPGFVPTANPARLPGAAKQIGRRGIVLTGWDRSIEEALERQTERQGTTDRGGQGHGEGTTWPSTASLWPSVPLPR